MINKKYLGKKNINFNLDINSKPIYILHNGLKIFLIKNNNKLLNIELKINHPVIYNKYIYIIKILFDNLIKIGNNKINNKKINKILIKNLAKLNFNFGGFKLNIFKKNIENIFSLIKKIFIKAVFNNKKQFIKLLKKTILYNKIYNNNPELIINNLKNKFFYKNNFPHNLCFLKKDIYTLRLKNIKKIFKKYFIPNNSYLFFSGNISKQKTIYLVNKYFSK
ncbi:MAG: hypothetical protein ABNO52_00370 [Candidatus Shikimatogenerans sp. Tser]|uniref:Peptidase M16 C-terminal domain-containing protein n=1 Tax=Candidatus Shikimatogenerans sp. Tser TaxID=3158568 RepID=A0AAU7QQZ8_9FLAO